MSTMPIGPNDPNFKYLTPIQQRMAMAAQGAPLPTVEDFIRGLGQQGGDPFSQTPQGINALPEQSPVAPPPVDPAMGMPGPVAGPTPEQAGMAPQAGGPPANFAVVDDYIDSGDNARDIYSEQNPAPQKKLGLFGRINQKPGGSRALLALGASLLSAPNFFTGLGQGGLAFQDALDKEAEKLKPKRSFIAGGAFQVVQNADGTTTIERTPVADYEQQNLSTKLETQKEIGKNRIEGAIAMNDADNDTLLKKATMEAEAAAKAAAKAQDWEKTKFYEGEANKFKLAEIEANAKGSGGKPSASVIENYSGHKKRSLTLEQTQREIGLTLGRIQRGELPLNLAKGLEYKGRAVLGLGNEQSTNYQELVALVNKMTLAITQSSVGVQTNFDYEKAALQTALSNNDEAGVVAALTRMNRIFDEEKALANSFAAEYEKEYDLGNVGGASAPSRKTQSIREKYGLE